MKSTIVFIVLLGLLLVPSQGQKNEEPVLVEEKAAEKVQLSEKEQALEKVHLTADEKELLESLESLYMEMYEDLDKERDAYIMNMERELTDSAYLLFRALDSNRDGKVTEDDIKGNEHILKKYMKDVTPEEFYAFIDLADENNDKALTRKELLKGLSAGFNAAPEFLETEAMIGRKSKFFGKIGKAFKKGFKAIKKVGKKIWKGVKKVGKKIWKGVKKVGGALLKGAVSVGKKVLSAAVAPAPAPVPVPAPQIIPVPRVNPMPAPVPIRFPYPKKIVMKNIVYRPPPVPYKIDMTQLPIDSTEDGCVICQYLVERIEANVKQAGVIPQMSSPSPSSPVSPASFLELESKVSDPFDQAATAIIDTQRQSTRTQRELERQKYNEIYRLGDVTLDDVCEQSMPSFFYGYCKFVYQKQSDIVDGLRYQYRPADICFKVGLCAKTSYVTRGVHSRYNKAGDPLEGYPAPNV